MLLHGVAVECGRDRRSSQTQILEMELRLIRAFSDNRRERVCECVYYDVFPTDIRHYFNLLTPDARPLPAAPQPWCCPRFHKVITAAADVALIFS